MAGMNNRLIVAIGSVIAGVLIAVVVLLVILIQQNNRAAETAEHERAVAICERQLIDPYGEDRSAFIECLEDLLP